MTNHTGLSPLSPIKYLGPNVYLAVVVTRNRGPTGADYRQPETGKLYPFNTFWLVGKNPTTGIQGDMWYLSKIVANVAFWIKLSAGTSGPLINIQVQAIAAPGVNPVAPTGLGIITFNGAAVPNANIPVQTITRALNTLNLEVQYAGAAAVATAAESGLAHFNSTEFTVDPNTGFVSLSAGAGTLTSLTGDDALAATPTLGNINLIGAIVASGTHALRPLFFRRSASDTETLDLQLSTAAAASVATNVGVSSFDSASFTVDANGYVKSKFGNQPGVSNLGIAYSAGTFTVQGANGAALSAANPAFVTLQDGATPGRLITVAVTANQTFTDAVGSGNTNSWQAGVPPVNAVGGASSNWITDMPFFLHAVLGTANDIAFMISRNPCANTSPAATSISKTGTILNVNQAEFFSLLGVTIANYASRPSLPIGSFRMRNVVSAGNINYTVQALNATDGIGKFQDNVTFTVPSGVNGAQTNTVFANTGTPPIFTQQNLTYRMHRNGMVWYQFDCLLRTTAAPVGVVTLQAIFPLAPIGLQIDYTPFNYTSVANSPNMGVFSIGPSLATSSASPFILNGNAPASRLVNTSIAQDESLNFNLSYPAFN